MKIYLNELTEQEKVLDFSESEDWVTEAVEQADESEGSIEESLSRVRRPVSVHFSLRKVDDVVVLSGDVDTFIQLVCSRCATAFQQTCAQHFEALFCKDPVMAGVGYLQKQQGSGEMKPKKLHGYARHAHNEADDEMVSQGKDLDITYLSQDFIELGAVLTEQLQFQVPFQPLCSASCLGICSQCGTDLNYESCKCAPLEKPLAMLKDFKVQQI